MSRDTAAGRFIAFEGGEGVGKSTQARLLAEHLTLRGIEVVTTREPGGTEGAEAIRALFVGGAVDRWTAMSELLLVMAAREDHLRRLILPALGRGAWVICDRFVDSTRVYQGIAGGLEAGVVDRLHAFCFDGTEADLAILLDMNASESLARRSAAGEIHRFEKRGAAFHRAVRDGFRQLAASAPDRFLVVDAALASAEIAATIATAIDRRYPPT